MDSRPGAAAERAATSGASAHETAVQGWSSRLAAWVAAVVIVQSITGLWIFLGPFSVAAQLQVLLHVGAGLALLMPYAWYQARHYLAWYRLPWTAVMVLGYLLAGMVVACLVSGLVLTWQAAFGRRIDYAWDLVHLVSGVVAFALTVIHVVLAAWQRRSAWRRTADLRQGMVRFGRGGLLWLAAAAFLVGVTAVAWPARPVEFPVPEGYSLSAYVQQSAEYRSNPFAPSYGRTASGQLVDPLVLSQSRSCGSADCHEQIYAEWEPSAHRFSAANPSFQAIQRNFAADRSPAETRYCAGCHDPISLFAGAKDIHTQSLSAPGMQEGCSCVVCHSITQVDVRGNADYVLAPPHPYLWEAGQGWRKTVGDFLIRAYPNQHLADYHRGMMRSPEYCGACHKQFIPEALNRFGVAPAQNQYDEWRMSHWHVDNPDSNLACVDCHMRLERRSTDPGRGETGAVRRAADDGAHRNHRFIATNFFMPQVMKLPGAAEQVRLTEEWIRGETVVPEIAHLWPPGPVADIELSSPAQVRAGELLRLQTLVFNRKAGHNLTTGPLDFMRIWVHLQVRDADGRPVAEWGGIDPQTREITDTPGQIHHIGNSRREGTLVLEGQPVNSRGEPILRHELWTSAGGKTRRVIFAGHTDNQAYECVVPAWAKSPLRIDADLNFRRYRQEFLNLVLPTLEQDTGVYQPTVPQAHAEASVALLGLPPQTAAR